MKKIVNGNLLKEKMIEAIDLLCNTVKTTLGPIGNNVIINEMIATPFITNDGVTIAKNIESDDKVINTILEIAKEASINTDETVGDGTTTTLVLLSSIFKNGINLINNNINPIILKEELNNTLEYIINELNKLSIKPTKKDLLNVAVTSSNDLYIGKIITDTFLKVNNITGINILEHDKNYTEVKYKKGYYFDTNLASLYYFKDKNEITISNPYILIVNTSIYDINDLSNHINFIIEKNKELIVIAHDYSDELINEILSLYLDNIAKIYLFKTPLYSVNNLIFLNDISKISNTEIINNINDIMSAKLGIINNIKINKEETIIEFNKNNNINNIIEEIKKDLNDPNSIQDRDFLNKRLSMFNTLTADILVGANTKTERRELKMRYIDALYAINSAKDGILLGSGIPLLKISEHLNINTNGDKILKNSISKPFEQILINSGLNITTIKNNIKDSNYNILYNVKTKQYENINNTLVIDSLSVIINTLKNAVSIASMLLTTSSLIINEENSKTIYNDFTEL